MNFFSDIFSFEFIYAFGWTILHSLWQSAVVAAILGLIMIVLRNKTSKLKYLATVLAMFTILCASISTFYFYYSDSDVAGINTPVTRQESNAISLALIDPKSPDPNLTHNVSIFTSIKTFLQNNLSIIVKIWFIGMIFFLFKFAGGFIYIYRIKTYKTQPVPVFWQKKIEQLCKKINIKRSVCLLQSAVIKIPMVIGHFKPVILLPISILTGMTADQVETIIIHELLHIHQRDYLINILQSIMEILYFFNPAIWWISSIMRVEREHCCDDIVVQLSKNSLNYIKALTNIETTGLTAMRPAVALLYNKNRLLNRIMRITQQPVPSVNFSTGLISTLLIVTTIITVVLFAGNNSFSSREQNEIVEKNDSLNFDYSFNFNHSDEWWYPIIKKHNIDLRAFSNFDYILETGKSNRVDNNKRITLDGFVIINTGSDYFIIKSSEAVYTINDSTYTFIHAELNKFSKSDTEPKSKEKISGEKLEINFRKGIKGTPSITITNLDKPQTKNSDHKWFPVKYSKPEQLMPNFIQDTSGIKSTLSGEFQYKTGDSISTGNNIIFKARNGVELEAKKITFNKNTETFETDLLKFLIIKNKVIINIRDNADGKYEYNANEIYRERKFIHLLGNATFNTADTKLKANEIIIDEKK